MDRHNREIHRNLDHWNNKPILQTIYKEFYGIISKQVNSALAGPIVELGSGIGNLKMVIPHAICTDLFKNPWIDQVENAYSLSFGNDEVSNLILFDVFHHLQYPGTALREFQRVLQPGGRVIIFDPSMGMTGYLVYGLFHHEPVGWFRKIEWEAPAGFDPWNSAYYAAQGNAERVFFSSRYLKYLSAWEIRNKNKFSAFSYILSGGYSKPQLIRDRDFRYVKTVETLLDHCAVLFSTRSLVVLQKN